MIRCVSLEGCISYPRTNDWPVQYDSSIPTCSGSILYIRRVRQSFQVCGPFIVYDHLELRLPTNDPASDVYDLVNVSFRSYMDMI